MCNLNCDRRNCDRRNCDRQNRERENRERENCDRENRERRDCDRENRERQDCDRKQKHVHEVTGSTAVVRECEECHNHRFCTVSGEAIRMCDSHVHEVKFHTDFSDKHYHEFCGRSGLAVDVGNGKHVHYLCGETETANGHTHKFQGTAVIESPTDFEGCDCN